MSLPRVTVLIANYNDEEYIDNAIESAINQDYPGPLTICIVDDGSDDSSWDIISSYFKKPTETKISAGTLLVSKNIGRYGHTQLIAIKSTNSGPSEARNIGIDQTINDTDIYAVLDSDDEMYENKISTCVPVFQQGDGMIGVVYADYDTLHVDSGRTIREFKEPYSRRRLTQECIVHSGSLVLKEALQSVLEETGYYDKTMRTCEDYDLWMRISEKYIIAHIPKALTKVRVTGNNSSSIVNKETWQKNWLKVMEKMQLRTK
tara:strand:+ start:283 stop:1065 length:783 start_codon:yes stop_codon:yes gene_type:complete